MGLKSKKGIFFSIDALIALMIIFIVILVAIPNIKQNKIESKIDEDILIGLSSISAEEFDNNYVRSLITLGIITDPNKSLLEQIGNFYVTNRTIASNIADEFLSTIKTKDNVGIWLENNLVSSKNATSIESARQIETSRQIISGVMLGQNITGYSARAFLSSNIRNAYSYFGGYVGDGNITLVLDYNGTINDAELELASNKDFQLYINGIYAGNHTKSPSVTSPSTYDLSNHLNKFGSGTNNLEFIAKDLYIAGGFLKVKYESIPTTTQKRQYFQGIQGLINLYDGLFIPGTPTSIDVNLDLQSNFTTFLNIGNVTIFNGTTNGRQTITVPNSQLSTTLNYNQLANKTTPIRLGLKNVSLIYSGQRFDIISVVDLSGSMENNCPGGSANPGETPCKINDAKNSTDELINTILNISGNRVALVGFEDYSKKADFHNLSNNSQTLRNIANNVWNAGGSTCICCGILKANSCFDEKIFYDGFNNQTAGTDPIGWTVNQGSSIIDITTQSLEGNRGLMVARTTSTNPALLHTFNPQQDKIKVEFLARHDTGTGRLRFELEGLDNALNYQDYVIIKMYGGFIRNNDNQVTPYILNRTYKIGIEITPNSNSYSLYINDTLVNSNLPVISTYSNIARLRFSTESATINYKLDGINISLTKKLCDSSINRTREMIVMSDGEPNRACGLDPSPDWDGDGTTIGDPQDQAIQAACIAKTNYNITVHSIALDINNGSLAEQTMQGIAACGNGGFYASNVTQLTQIYNQITRSILAGYSAQTFNTTNPQQSRLYPNSYISLNYQETQDLFGIPITIEIPFSNSMNVNFSIPSESTPIYMTAISYSGDKWTNKVVLNNETVYNLSFYGTNYIELGDPYAIRIDPNKLRENNSLSITTATSSGGNETYSANNKIIYTVLKNISAYSPISANRDGCNWEVYFEDNTNISILIPQNYTGVNSCIYSPISIIYDSNDAMQTAVYNLFRQLDLDLDGRIDFLFRQNEVTIDTTDIQGIPFPWSTEIQIRRWV
ncbi:MAG: vWA domain-containing protein [Nanoarchaeota archaeon]